jgi:DNA polymerase-3 subunit beta
MTNPISIEVPTATLKAALICASTDQSRYYLNGVYVDPKGFLVATDGWRAFVGKIDLTGVPAFDGWIICRDVLKRALTGYKADTITISPNHVGHTFCQPIDGAYPDWRRAVPDELSGETAQFNPAYIADMGKIGRLLSGKRDGGFGARIHHNGEGPAAITFPEIDDCFAVLMPFRLPLNDCGSEAWAQRRSMIANVEGA